MWSNVIIVEDKYFLELQGTWHVFMFVKTKGTRKNVISVAFTLKRLIPIKKVEGSPLLNTILHPVIW